MADAVYQAAATDGADEDIWGGVVGHLCGDFVHHCAVAGPDVRVVEGGAVDCCADVLDWGVSMGRTLPGGLEGREADVRRA